MDINGQLSPSQTMDVLHKLNHAPVKKLGQNFLIDANIVRKSIELANVGPGDSVVEVGPGLGTLTGALLQTGASVYAVELDKRLYAHLKELFKDTSLKLLNADALDFPLAQLPKDVGDFKIVSNLPYAISTPWLDAVLSGRLPKTMSLMLQKEAAERFVADGGTGDFSPISVFVSQAYDVAAKYKVSASCFYPRPAVDSVLLVLSRKEEPFVFAPKTKQIIRYAFSKRRKQILSIAKSSEEYAPIMAKWLDADAALARDSRPERIGAEHWRLLDLIVSQSTQ